MRDRLTEVARKVRENGVTYNVYADPQGSDRPWDLDLLPLILPHDEWAWIEGLRARPQNYVAQELVRLSHAPIWDRGPARRLLPRAVGLRVYAYASPGGYVVMPGGLTRVATGPDARVISMQRGGSSKDTRGAGEPARGEFQPAATN